MYGQHLLLRIGFGLEGMISGQRKCWQPFLTRAYTRNTYRYNGRDRDSFLGTICIPNRAKNAVDKNVSKRQGICEMCTDYFFTVMNSTPELSFIIRTPLMVAVWFCSVNFFPHEYVWCTWKLYTSQALVYLQPRCWTFHHQTMVVRYEFFYKLTE